MRYIKPTYIGGRFAKHGLAERGSLNRGSIKGGNSVWLPWKQCQLLQFQKEYFTSHQNYVRYLHITNTIVSTILPIIKQNKLHDLHHNCSNYIRPYLAMLLNYTFGI